MNTEKDKAGPAPRPFGPPRFVGDHMILSDGAETFVIRAGVRIVLSEDDLKTEEQRRMFDKHFLECVMANARARMATDESQE